MAFPETRKISPALSAPLPTAPAAVSFALPASELIEDCLSIAVLRLGEQDSEPSILFACLDEKGATIRIEHPGDDTRDLERFAGSFVGVLERIDRDRPAAA